MSDDEAQEITVERFKQNPHIHVSIASRIRTVNPNKGFQLNVVNPNNGPAVTILLTNSFHNKVGNVTRTENLERYKKNPTALNKAIDRVFQAAATGQVIGMEVRGYDGMSTTAYAYRADR